MFSAGAVQRTKKHAISWPVSLIASAVLCLLWLMPSGCSVPAHDGAADTFHLNFSLPAGSKTDGAILFLLDGVQAQTFDQMLQAGELPAIKKYFVDRGLYSPRTVTCNPSISMSCFVGILTGQYSSHAGMTAPKCFDRNQLMCFDVETHFDKNKVDALYTAPTIYEQFPDRLTFSLFCQVHRGATKFFENVLTAGPAIAFGMHNLIDRLSIYRFNQVNEFARMYHQVPAFTTVYMLAVDFAAYDHGFSSPKYRQAIRDVDRHIGRVMGDIQRAGLLDKLVVALVSDHGHVDTPRHPHLESYVRDTLGVHILTGEPDDGAHFEQRLAKYNRYVGVTCSGGNRYWPVYLRKPIRREGKLVGMDNWLGTPTPEDLRQYPTDKGADIDLPAELVAQPYVEAVAYRAGPEAVRMLFKGGEVEFRRTGGRSGPISCHVLSGDDPLKYREHVPAEMLSGKPFEQRQWLDATVGTIYPDLPVGVMAYFDGRLAPDLVAYPPPGWDLDGWWKSGHGGIRDVEMLVPMAIAGPNVPKGTVTAARTVDLMPTLLQALGKPIPSGLDGISLIAQP